MSAELARQSVAAARWGIFGSVGKFALQLGVNIAVARLLGPDAYGLFALATIALLVATFLSEVGLGWSLMQRAEIDDRAIRFVFSWQCLSGLAGFLLMALGSHLMAEFLREPRLVEVLRCLGLCCLFNGMAATATNLLRREMRFRALTQIQLASYALAYGLVGLPMAYLGHGVWALVTAWVVQAALGAVLSYRARPHPLRPLLKIERPGEYVDIGLTVLLTNLCNWALLNIDRLLLGRLAGTHAAGIYAVGYNLATVPNGLLISALQPAFLASGARLQEDRPKMARAYLEVQGFIWVVMAPLFVLLAVAGQQIVGTLYGSAWTQSAIVFSCLALAMPAYLAWALSTPVLWNTDRKWFELGLQLPLLCLALPALAWASGQGAGWVAMFAGSLFMLRYLVALLPALRALQLTLSSLKGLAVRSFLMMACVGAATVAAQLLLRPHIQSAWMLACFEGAAGLLPWLAAVAIRPQWLGRDAARLLKRFVPGGTIWGKAWLARAGLAAGKE